MQTTILDTESFLEDLTQFALASSCIMDTEIPGHSALDIVTTLAEALLAAHGETEESEDLETPESTPIGFSVRNINTDRLPTSMIFHTRSEAQTYAENLGAGSNYTYEAISISGASE